MIKEETIKAIIEKAIKNGYSQIEDTPENREEYTDEDFDECNNFEVCLDRCHFYMIKWTDDYYDGLRDVIFSHDFAKAFFGKDIVREELYYCDKEKGIEEKWSDYIGREAWVYHLKKMAISEDPIVYLSKFI